MNNQGYIYTIVTVTLVLIILSLTLFFFQISEPETEEIIAKIRMDELHYFIESVKLDFSRATSISAQRATTYSIDHILRTNESLWDYNMVNCTQFNYSGYGSQAAIAELMFCGTFNGTSKDSALYMENNTIPDWIKRITKKGEEINFFINITLKNIEIMPYDSFRFAVVSTLDIIASDKLNQSFYKSYNVPVISIVSITSMEDPLYYMKTGRQSLIRYFTPCESSFIVDGKAIDYWINSECYHSSNPYFYAPSFFDRLDGNLNISEKYLQQSYLMADSMHLPTKDIGLESFVNLDDFATYNISVDLTRTWIDYLYWLNVSGDCSVNNMLEHPDFLIDNDEYSHLKKYEIKGAVCQGGVQICNVYYPCGSQDFICPRQFGAPCIGIPDPDCGGVTICNEVYNCGGLPDHICPEKFGAICKVQDPDCL